MIRIILPVILMLASLSIQAKKYYKLKIELMNGEKLVGIVSQLSDSTLLLEGISRKNIPDSTTLSRTLSFAEIRVIKSKKLGPLEPAIGLGAGLLTGLVISASQGPCGDDLSGIDCELNKEAIVFYPALAGALIGFLVVFPKNFNINSERSAFKSFHDFLHTRARLKA